MATFEIEGITELNEAFSKMSDVPKETKSDILNSMAVIAKNAIKSKGEAYGIRSKDDTQKHLLDSLKIGKPRYTKNGGYIKVTFSGRRKNGVKQEWIAFLNEFGTKHMTARPFVNDAILDSQDKIFKAGEEKFHQYLDSI